MSLIYILTFLMLSFINIYVLIKYKISSYIGLGSFYFLTILLPTPYIYYNLGELYLFNGIYNNFIHIICLTIFYLSYIVFDKLLNNRLLIYHYKFHSQLPDKVWLKSFANFAMIVGAISSLSGYILAEHDLIEVIFSNVAEVYVSEKSPLGGFLDQGLVLINIGAILRIVVAENMASKLTILLGLSTFHMAFSFSRGGLIPVLLMYLISNKLIGCTHNGKQKNNRLSIIFISFLFILVAAVAGGVATIKRAAVGAYELDSNTIVMSFISRLEDRFFDANNSLYVGFGNILYRTTFEDVSLKHGEVIYYSIFSNIPKFLYTEKPVHPMRATNYFVYTDRPPSNNQDVSAFGLVGSAYYDFGILSAIFYLICFALIINLYIFLARRHKYNLLLYLGLLFFDGPQNFIHAGIISIFGNLIYATMFILITILIIDIYRYFINIFKKMKDLLSYEKF